MDFESAREYLAKFGFELRRQKDRWSVYVPKKLAATQDPILAELCTIEQEGGSYNVMVLNLPQFFGPEWRALTGGKPQLLESGSIEEIVELLQAAVGRRMTDGVLHG